MTRFSYRWACGRILFLALLWFLPWNLGWAQLDGTTTSEPESMPSLESYWQPAEPIELKLNVPATRLDLYIKNQLIRSFQVAIGTPRYPTPHRDYKISMIIWNPWWIPPDSEWAQDAEKTPPGPGNPLGVVKLIMEDGIRIHGTNAPRSIGRASSHACLRMHNEEARELAWEIQKRYSEKIDAALLDKYRRNRRHPYYVKLLGEVPVSLAYQQVERKGDRLLLHPNPYGRPGFETQLTEALMDHPEVLIDKALIKKLNKLRRGKTTETSIEDLVQWSSPLASRLPPSPRGTGGPLNSHADKALMAQP